EGAQEGLLGEVRGVLGPGRVAPHQREDEGPVPLHQRAEGRLVTGQEGAAERLVARVGGGLRQGQGCLQGLHVPYKPRSRRKVNDGLFRGWVGDGGGQVGELRWPYFKGYKETRIGGVFRYAARVGPGGSRAARERARRRDDGGEHWGGYRHPDSA